MKALEQLAQQGKIKEKMYGKQKIYFADQVREPVQIIARVTPRH